MPAWLLILIIVFVVIIATPFITLFTIAGIEYLVYLIRKLIRK